MSGVDISPMVAVVSKAIFDAFNAQLGYVMRVGDEVCIDGYYDIEAVATHVVHEMVDNLAKVGF